MSKVPQDLKYAKTHEWVRIEDDGTVTVGISDHAQDLLGDMVFIELPEVGRELEAEEDCAVVESVKAASDIYAPITGEVTAVNEALEDAPDTVNSDPYGEGWLFRMRPTDEASVAALLDAEGYAAVVAAEQH